MRGYRAFLMTNILRAPDDGGAGGGGQQQQQQQQQPSEPPAWGKELQDAVKGLTQNFNGLVEMAKAAQQRSAQQQQQTQQQTKSKTDDDDDEGEEPDEVDLETMSNKELISYINKKLSKSIEKSVIEPINTRLSEITAATTQKELVGEIERLKGQHKDFAEWRDEMLALAREHPSLGPARLYQLARLDNPDKVKQLETKYKGDDDTQVQKAMRISFGGLMPSPSGSGSKSQKMAPTDAAEAAWAETVKGLGAEPFFGE